MNRTELISKVSEQSGLSRREAETALEHIEYAITAAVKAGDSVRITGFGTFRLRERAARTGRNPQTGASVKIKASKSIAFAPGATLKAELNTRGAVKKPGSGTTAAAPAKRTTAAKAPAAKATAKRTTAAKAPAAKAPAAKSTAKRATSAAKAPVAKAATTAKATAKRATTSKAPAKATASKATAKKAPAKRAAKR